MRLLLPLLVLVALAGCGEEESEPVAATEVEMVKSYRFEPKAIRIRAGDTVTWTNRDNFTHTVQVDGQEDHEAEPGESVELTFGEPGTYHYVCTLHRRDMDGTVIVE